MQRFRFMNRLCDFRLPILIDVTRNKIYNIKCQNIVRVGD